MECSKTIKSNLPKGSLKAYISLLIFCVDDLSFDETGVLKSPMIFMLLSLSPFMFVSVCFICWGTPMLGAYMFVIVKSSFWFEPLIIMYCFVSYNTFIWSLFCLIRILLLQLSYDFHLHEIPSPIHFQCVSDGRCKAGLLFNDSVTSDSLQPHGL